MNKKIEIPLWVWIANIALVALAIVNDITIIALKS
jgi:hypothetical protein